MTTHTHSNTNVKCICGHSGSCHHSFTGSCDKCHCTEFTTGGYNPKDRTMCVCGHVKHRHRGHVDSCYDCECPTFFDPTEDEVPLPLGITESTDDPIDHPSHYGGDTIYEAVKVIRFWGLGFNLGNAAKYICRAGKKDSGTYIEDLKKAIWYLQDEINAIERPMITMSVKRATEEKIDD